MADEKCISDDVAESLRQVYGPQGEMQALMQLYRNLPEDDFNAWALLAESAMERMSQTFDAFTMTLRRNGYPAGVQPARQDHGGEAPT